MLKPVDKYQIFCNIIRYFLRFQQNYFDGPTKLFF